MTIPEPSKRFVLLDGARGIAAFGVLALHLYLGKYKFYYGANIFVDFFFVLSGFVLAPQILGNTRDIRRFIIKRIIRLWPALLPVFIFIYAREKQNFFQPLDNTPVSYTLWAYLGSFLLLQVYSNSFCVNYPIWSLSSEVLANLVATSFKKIDKNLNIFIFISGVLLFITLALNDLLSLNWKITEYAIAALRGCLGFFLGLKLRQTKADDKVETNSIRLLFGSVFFLTVFLLIPISSYFLILAPFTCVVLIEELSKMELSSEKIQTKRLMLYLGRISYGVYIWHVPLAGFQRHIQSLVPGYEEILNSHICSFILQISVILFATEVTIRIFERPIQKFAIEKFL